MKQKSKKSVVKKVAKNKEGWKYNPPKNVKIKRSITQKQQAIEIRREIINSLDSIYTKPSEITKYLIKGREKEKKRGEVGGQYTLMLNGVRNVYDTVHRDLTIIRANRKTLLNTNEVDKTKAEYLATQIELLNKAVSGHQYAVASEIAGNIAKARGLDITKLSVEHSVEGLTLTGMFELLAKKQKE